LSGTPTIGRDGETATYSYDDAGQLTGVTSTAGTTTWAYDGCGRLSVEDRDGSIASHSYDAAGQLLATTTAGGVTTHTYDLAGRRTHTDLPDGDARDFEWGRTGWLAGITDRSTNGPTRRTALSVDTDGHLSAVNGLPITWDVAQPVPVLAGIGDASVLATGPLTGVGNTWNASGWRTGAATSAIDPWTQADGRNLAGGISISRTGGLAVAGLDWLGSRVYDPASRGFLSVDPLPATPGAGWAGNPYSYAGNNPLLFSDPTGLHPLSDADLKAYAAAHQGALAVTGDWISHNWEYLAGGAMVVAGGVLMATGVGGPLGVALISAGVDTIIQKATTGSVNWGEVAISGALGAVGGGAASWASAASSAGLSALKTTVLVNGGAGALTSEGMYLFKNQDHLSWDGALGAGVGGFVGGAVGGAAGPAGGTIAKALGRSTTGLMSMGATTLLNVGGGAAGNLSNQLIANPGGGVDFGQVGLAGATGGGASILQTGISKIPTVGPALLGSPKGINTLDQLSRFGPRTAQGVVNFSGTNTQALWKGVGAGVVVGVFSP
jgi:RHS repeat-associated protein